MDLQNSRISRDDSLFLFARVRCSKKKKVHVDREKDNACSTRVELHLHQEANDSRWRGKLGNMSLSVSDVEAQSNNKSLICT